MPEQEYDDRFSRYQRQMKYPPIGNDGQQKLSQSRVLLCGCGALGSVIANTLVRAGIGFLRLVDRDFLEMNNLQRQVLFDQADVAAGIPKAIAATEKLRRINSEVEIEPHVIDLNHSNIESLCENIDLILDGTDNFETRFLVNDASVCFNIPWVYGGCLGADGQTMTIIPGKTPCLHCLMFEGPPLPGTTPTCDSAGILAPIINVIASIQASEAIKLLSGNADAISRKLNVFELWENRIRQVDLSTLRDGVDCPTCKRREFPWLHGERGSHTAVLCGRNSVQLSFPERAGISLESLENKLIGLGKIQRNSFMLRFESEEYILTVFPDGRAIIGGTEDVAIAKSIYARFVGN